MGLPACSRLTNCACLDAGSNGSTAKAADRDPRAAAPGPAGRWPAEWALPAGPHQSTRGVAAAQQAPAVLRAGMLPMLLSLYMSVLCMLASTTSDAVLYTGFAYVRHSLSRAV